MSASEELVSIKNLLRAGGLPGYLFLFNNILIFIVKRGRSLDEYSSVDTSALLQIIYTFVVFGLAFHTLVFRYNARSKLLFIKPNAYLLLFIIICFVSALWSFSAPLVLYRAFETLTYLILICWLVYNLSMRLDVQNLIEFVVLWAVWCIFWSIATGIKLSGLNYLNIAFMAARLQYPIAIFFALLLSKRKWLKYIVLGFAFASFSNKIYLGFSIGLIGFLFGNSKSKGIIFVFILILTGLLTFLDLETLLKSTIFIGREEVSIENSSGRNYVWRVAYDAFVDSPFIGYGFVEGESDILFSKFKGAISSHNFFFSGLLGTGLLGTVFLLLYFISIFRIGFNKYWPKNNWKVAVIGTLIMSLVLSLSSPGLGGRVYGSWISVVFVITVICALNLKFKYYAKTNNAL